MERRTSAKRHERTHRTTKLLEAVDKVSDDGDNISGDSRSDEAKSNVRDIKSYDVSGILYAKYYGVSGT